MNGKLIEFINRYDFEKRLKSLNYKTPIAVGTPVAGCPAQIRT